MSEPRTNEIIYEEGWRDAAEPIALPDDEVPVDEAPLQPKPRSSFPLLITIRLSLCLLFLLVLFLLKSMDSPVYHSLMEYYRAELSRPVISRGIFDAMDVSRLLQDPPVEVTEDRDALLYR